jgi:hypothetical protein
MNDRELLELAAKAAGAVPDPNVDDTPPGIYIDADDQDYIYDVRPNGDWLVWNPLNDDGHALRLAVKLHLTCRHFMGETVAQSTVPGGPSVYITDTCHRRAIVRAAAEIGKAMP